MREPHTPNLPPVTGPTWLANEAVIAGRLLVLGATLVAGLWVLTKLQRVVAAGS